MGGWSSRRLNWRFGWERLHLVAALSPAHVRDSALGECLVKRLICCQPGTVCSIFPYSRCDGDVLVKTTVGTLLHLPVAVSDEISLGDRQYGRLTAPPGRAFRLEDLRDGNRGYLCYPTSVARAVCGKTRVVLGGRCVPVSQADRAEDGLSFLGPQGGTQSQLCFAHLSRCPEDLFKPATEKYRVPVLCCN
ncbi:hypothetical protein VTK73DRAFT_8561 [Phialemonium thermophilum]|uniref:Uncharacterized protein n=1 Tax=Phialemonium thermophilum TaxID=223376 RepID=A0ABR3XPW3_9PEZI